MRGQGSEGAEVGARLNSISLGVTVDANARARIKLWC